MTRTAALAVASSLAFAACGGLESPDLEKGTIEGRVVGALAGAYVYPFGRPDLRTGVESSDGRFRIEEVPVETAAIVVVDGEALDGTHRAQMIGVEVRGAERTVIGDVDATAMPLAGSVVATVQLACGAQVVAPSFTVVGTDQRGVVAPAESAELEPLPGGTFDLATSMHGFRESRTVVIVSAGAATPAVVSLEIDGGDDAPGCVTSGCRNGLLCSGDGYCYECLSSSDCGGGAACDPELHVCGTVGPGTGAVCSACADAGQCGGVNPWCVPSGTSGYCSRTCSGSPSECPAGFDCVSNLCVAQYGCASYLAAFGASCFDDGACQALRNGRCQGAVSSPTPIAGYCTAQCASNADCIVTGYTCDAAATRLCTRP